MATFEEIQKANSLIVKTDIKGKSYADVSQRIKAFRRVYPDGCIKTEMVSNENGVCIFRAYVYSKGYSTLNGDEFVLLGTGTAYEKEGSSFINKTSYIENAETSAVGRALGMAGFGLDTEIASVEEVSNAINNQPAENAEEKKPEQKATPKQIEFLLSKYEGENLKKLLKTNNLEKLEDMPMIKASELINKIKKQGEKNEKDKS